MVCQIATPVYARRSGGHPTLRPSASAVCLFPYAVYALVFIWGVAIVIVSLGMVSKVLAFASDATDVANSIYSRFVQCRYRRRCALGHYVTVWFGLSNIGIAGALLAATGFAVCGLLFEEQDNLTQNV